MPPSKDWRGTVARMSDLAFSSHAKATPQQLRGADNVRPTGEELFGQLTAAEQNELLGPQVAEAVRTGARTLEDLVQPVPMETEDDFITQATPQDLGLTD